MTQAICGVNASCYEASPEPSTATVTLSGSGGAAAHSTHGAEGAGNIEKNGEPEASLRCLPELVMAASDCGKSVLLRNLTGALVCGLRLEALRACLVERANE